MLRPYQKECIQKSIEAFQSLQRICVSLPVGSGKTVIFSNLIQAIPKPQTKPLANKVLVLAHRKELLYQAYHQIQKFNPSLKISMDQGSLKTDKNADVICGSIQTLGREDSRRMDEMYQPDLFKAVIIDESHHAAASTYQRILNRLGVYEDEGKHIKVWGCSATLRRHDGMSLQPTFQEIVFHKHISEMIDDKWLCDVRVNTVKTKLILGSVKSTADDFNLKDLSKRVNCYERNQVILETYKEQRILHNRKSALVFAVDIQHVQDLSDTFNQAGIKAFSIHSKISSIERADILEKLKSQEIQVVINCGILTEGVDIPAIDMILLARPTKSGVLLQQMLGRGMRLFPGKEYCLVLDFVDVIDDRMVLATVPTLLGLNPMHTLKNESLKSVLQNADESTVGTGAEIENNETALNQMSEMTVQVTLQPFLKPFCLASSDKDSIFLRKYSELAWIRCGKEKFVLSLYSGKYAKLERDDHTNLWHGSLKQIVKSSKGAQFHKQLFSEDDSSGVQVPITFTHDNFQNAIQCMDLLVNSRFGYRKFKWNASWRTGTASSGQLQYLQKLGVQEKLTKGAASDFIVKRMFGASGNATRENTVKKKIGKRIEKYSLF